jgi:hypothetical protein
MHRSCFIAWQHRAEYVELFNSSYAALIWGNGKSTRMQEDGTLVKYDACQESELTEAGKAIIDD